VDTDPKFRGMMELFASFRDFISHDRVNSDKTAMFGELMTTMVDLQVKISHVDLGLSALVKQMKQTDP
jgi:hypothetical protein